MNRININFNMRFKNLNINKIELYQYNWMILI